MTVEELLTHIDTIEVTMDNWQDYVELRKVVVDNKNAFGEVEGVETFFGWYLKENIEGAFAGNFGIEFKNKKNNKQAVYEANYVTNFLTTVSFLMDIGVDYEPTDFDCLRVTGNVYILNLPEGTYEVREDGKKYVFLKDNNEYMSYSIYDTMNFASWNGGLK